MLAPTPPWNAARLAAIRRYALGEGIHTAAFDGIVELAAQVCNCPIALVSVVREEDQHFEAVCGLPLSGTPLESSVCSHAILLDDLLEIPDLREDMRTHDNPLVTDPDDPLIFYAGAQVRTSEGVALGSLCVLDRRPRRLGDKERHALRILAHQVMQRLELYDALRQQDVLRREVDHRVKNNLANVAVLTRMASRTAVNPETREALAAVERRIQVMVELHSELYGAPSREDDSVIPVSKFLGRIVNHLQAIAPPKVVIETRFDEAELNSRRASALGVLVNELTSNACKHAFPDGREGRVTLTGDALPGNRYRLICEDDGVGLPGGFERTDEAGLGLRIMHASASQLGGHLIFGGATPPVAGVRGTLEFLLPEF